MKISDIPSFLKQTPTLSTPPFLWGRSEPLFFQTFEKLKPSIYKKRGTQLWFSFINFYMADVNYNLLMEKMVFIFFINHFTAKSCLSPVNWSFLEAVSFCSQYGIFNSRNGFLTSSIFGGIIHNLFLSQGCLNIQLCCIELWLVWSPSQNWILISQTYSNPLKCCFAYIFL